MAGGQSGQTSGSSGTSKGGATESSGSSAGIADQARETLRGATDKASEALESASKYGAHYYRKGSRYYQQGSRAISDMDSSTMTALLIAGALGFGLGWLVFGQRSYSGDYIPRRMSASSERNYY